MVTVQAEGCAPIIRAYDEGAERSTMFENAHTVADGLRVPKAIGDLPGAAGRARERWRRGGCQRH
jgi:hypothetical protein